MKLLALLLITGCQSERFDWPSRAEQSRYNDVASRATGIDRRYYRYVPAPTARQIALENDRNP